VTYLSTPEGLDSLQSAIARGLALFTPPPALTVSEWADRFARLPREASAEPGQWITARAEYERAPMDAVTDPAIETIVLMWASQLGKTAIILNVIGYFCEQDPSPILFLMPTLDMAESVSKDRIATMIRDTPVLNPLFGDPKSRDSGNTLLHKLFPGGHLTLAGANSPASLASRPIRILISDEVDRYPASAGTEGDPIRLAAARTTNFWNRKKILTSTPGTKGASRIEDAFEKSSDMRFYFVPCPQCGEFQKLQWSQLKWPSPRTGATKHEPEKCYYVCEHNGCEITEGDKPAMIAAGKWIATKPGNGDGKTAGFHLNALYSPWKTWPEIIHDFLEANTPEKLRTFVNTVLAETWEVQGESVNDAPLLARRENYPADCPAGVLVLTAGVDVQKDRIEVEVDGWGLQDESWAIEHRIFRGNTAILKGNSAEDASPWEQLDAYLQKTFEHEFGIQMRISCALVDSGDQTKQVYAFCKSRQVRRIFASKGMAGAAKPLAGYRPQKGKHKGTSGVLLIPVGVDTAKEVLYGRLKVETFGPGFCHYPIKPEFDEEYFKQLTAEKRTTKKKEGGFEVGLWVKTRPRNEALDLRVLSLAALDVLKPNFPAIAANLEKQVEYVKEQEKPAEPPKQILGAPPQSRPRMPVRRQNSWINSWRS
jgi:phage terminase large subunit GpA-like protein